MDVRFYHLTTKPFAEALPVILQKAISSGRRGVILLPDEESVRHYDDLLWTYRPESFLPHAAAGSGREADQPVYLTSQEENPNGADMIVLYGHRDAPESLATYALCCDFLDGGDDGAVADARKRWKAYKDAGHAVTYWQQTETGGWEQKA